MRRLNEWYINFLEKEKRNIIEKIIYFFFFLLSLIYGAIVTGRNFLYNSGIFKTYKCRASVISIGNLSWGGSGKTTLSYFLYQKFMPQLKVAVLRRGYGLDERKLFEERKVQVFTSINRVKLTNRLSDKFDLFILDDGFQYRKLYRNINILVMGARELKRKHRLIPADFFREPLIALRRADILIINHKNELNNIGELTANLQSKFNHLSIYTAEYQFNRIIDMKNKEMNLGAIKEKKLAALTGIGYPRGFFNKLEELGIKVCRKITYPDHYDLTTDDFNSLQENLLKEGIHDVIITEKDKYHLPDADSKINFYILEIEMKIAEEQRFLDDLTGRLQ
ncbi:MAG: tetraacyldisaccharide 4'-kinase [Candidatus Omnitrophica bacterium]|nr:tetraacyldisaccharide 4'-kinase [Candidatus Omnitrophota bacterium]